MWPRMRTLLSVMALGAVAGGLLQWQVLRLQENAGGAIVLERMPQMEQRVGSVVIGKTDDGWYAPLLRRAAEQQLIRQQQPCVIGVCQDI